MQDKNSTATVLVQILEGVLDEDFCIAVIKVNQDYVISNKAAILKHYLYVCSSESSNREYAEGFDYSVQESLGFPRNVDWPAWLIEYPFNETGNSLLKDGIEQVLFVRDADILEMKKISLEEGRICFKVRCGFNRLAKKFGATAERIEGVLDFISREMPKKEK